MTNFHLVITDANREESVHDAIFTYNEVDEKHYFNLEGDDDELPDIEPPIQGEVAIRMHEDEVVEIPEVLEDRGQIDQPIQEKVPASFINFSFKGTVIPKSVKTKVETSEVGDNIKAITEAAGTLLPRVPSLGSLQMRWQTLRLPWIRSQLIQVMIVVSNLVTILLYHI